MLQGTGTLQSKAAKSRRTDAADTAGASDNWTGTASIIGEVCKVAADGTFVVDFPTNPLGPIVGRTVVDDLYAGAKVLLVFEQGDPTRPIVLGVVHDRVRTKERQLHFKATRIILEASDGISLQCGEARLEAAKDGKLKLGGRDIVSRASRTNKVQGSTVRLN